MNFRITIIVLPESGDRMFTIPHANCRVAMNRDEWRNLCHRAT